MGSATLDLLYTYSSTEKGVKIATHINALKKEMITGPKGARYGRFYDLKWNKTSFARAKTEQKCRYFASCLIPYMVPGSVEWEAWRSIC